MKILLITWYFPPHNTVAAIRLGKLARFLTHRGHDVRVLTTRKENIDCSLEVEIPKEHVIVSDWYDINDLAHPIAVLQRRKAKSQAKPKFADNIGFGFRRHLGAFYDSLFFLPDRYVGWYPQQVRDGNALLRTWRPNVIYVSGPPFSPFLGARHLAHKHGIPWIAEFRDRWTDDPYFPPPKWRAWLDIAMENWLIRKASALVTVSPPWVDFYKHKHDKTTVLAYNGYATEDFPDQALDSDPGPVRIVHMGTIYAGRRDPEPLFQALAEGKFSPKQVLVCFYGAGLKTIHDSAERLGVQAFVELHPSVPYQDSVEIQRRADLLLLLQWNNPREQGNVPAKLFEYLAVRRPILGIGLKEGVPARIIRQRHAGLFSNDPTEIVEHLHKLIDEKQGHGVIAPLPESVRDGLSRDEQFVAVEGLLERICDASHRPTVAAIRQMPCFKLADTSSLERPVLCVAVDAEEEFDWRAPFSRLNTSVESISRQHLAQQIFSRYGIKPTYLVDYPVASNLSSVRILRRLLDAGECEIGAQLHPWVNPPHEEEVNVHNSFLSNLPPKLQKRKLTALTETILSNFGVKPRVFKAGRYGFDITSAELLEEFGYEVDASIMPLTSFALEGGPDFLSIPDRAFWFGKDNSILELPMARGFAGLMSDFVAGRFAAAIYHPLQAGLHIAGILSRFGLLERITLSPEGIDHNAHRRLTERMLARGHRIFQFSYHSSSLLPGGTPYVRNAHELDQFLDRIDKYLHFFFNEIGGISLTHVELCKILAEANDLRAGTFGQVS